MASPLWEAFAERFAIKEAGYCSANHCAFNVWGLLTRDR